VSGTAQKGRQMTAQQKIQAAREEFRKTLEAKRMELQKNVQARREALKTRLQNIKDERKKAAVERIDKNMAELNARMTAHYASALDQIDAVLLRIVARTDKAQADGKDVSTVRSAITAAQGAISAARAAVVSQTGETYSMSIRTEATLKDDVGGTRQALHDDLVRTRGLVKDAREAVRKVAVALAQIPGIGSGSSSTPTTTNQ
jgi:hypothetical protein